MIDDDRCTVDGPVLPTRLMAPTFECWGTFESKDIEADCGLTVSAGPVVIGASAAVPPSGILKVDASNRPDRSERLSLSDYQGITPTGSQIGGIVLDETLGSVQLNVWSRQRDDLLPVVPWGLETLVNQPFGAMGHRFESVEPTSFISVAASNRLVIDVEKALAAVSTDEVYLARPLLSEENIDGVVHRAEWLTFVFIDLGGFCEVYRSLDAAPLFELKLGYLVPRARLDELSEFSVPAQNSPQAHFIPYCRAEQVRARAEAFSFVSAFDDEAHEATARFCRRLNL